MRTIDATLLSNQDTLHGKPCRELIVGTSPNTIDLSSYALSYDYQEDVQNEGHLIITLDNKTGYFNTLTGDKAYITAGAEVQLKRGLTISGTDYTEELPTAWIETAMYTHVGGTSILTLECIDWLGKLDRWFASTEQTWSSTSATTILEWILTQVSLTRASGAMTALTIDFAIRLREAGKAALNRLVRKLPEYLYAGLDGEIKWKNIDSADASVYTFGWNANHPLLRVEGGWGAWEVNSLTIKGRSSSTGTASDATQISKCGTRKCTLYDDDLTSDAQCAQSAQAELDIYEAEATALGTLVCRPCHGLELLDVVTVDSPPWGGANVVGRVIRYTEEWNHDGRWHQVIELGETPEKDPGNQPAKKKRTKGRRKRKSRRRKGRRRRRRDGDLEERLELLVPIGVIVMWSGEIVPANFALCDGANGTPNLSGCFIVSSGGGYSIGDTGGEDSSDLQHTHGPGTLTTDSDAHTHGPGTLNTDSDAHTHGPGTLNTDSDAHIHDVTGSVASDSHSHEAGTLTAASDAHTHALNTTTYGPPGGAIVLTTATQTESDAHTHDVAGDTASDSHSHGDGTLATDSDSHDHDVDSGVTASDSHDHDVDSGVTASDSHNHDVDSGVTANAGAAAQENRPLYYTLAFIMRIA